MTFDIIRFNIRVVYYIINFTGENIRKVSYMIWNKIATALGSVVLIGFLISVVIYFGERVSLNKSKVKEGRKNLAIITGASSGLGRDFGKFLDEHREYGVDELIVIARRRERLEELKNSLSIPTTVYPMDMREEGELNEFQKFLKKKVEEEDFDIKYLINSAGLGYKGESLELGADKEIGTLKINCEAQISIIHIAANLMREGGNIIQIASVAAFSPIGYMNAYSASKGFIYNYTRGLRSELLKKGINVTTVCPYFIDDTEFVGKANMGDKKFFLPLKSKHVVEKSMRDTKRKFAMSTPGVVATVNRIFSGLIPDEVMVYLTRLFV